MGHVLTSGLSAGDKWPKILSNVGGLGVGPVNTHDRVSIWPSSSYTQSLCIDFSHTCFIKKGDTKF